ncbi:hypothetical protein BwiPL1_58260 (plasmid) [Bacillus wiedmannii]|nr:hypothetical protein BwiPL1_58260 [Bacillus wiedmannii]
MFLYYNINHYMNQHGLTLNSRVYTAHTRYNGNNLRYISNVVNSK